MVYRARWWSTEDAIVHDIENEALGHYAYGHVIVADSGAPIGILALMDTVENRRHAKKYHINT